MEAPDRIWASFFHGEDSHVYPVSVSDKYSPAGVQYLRASSELLAMREVVLGWYRGKMGAAEKMEAALRAYAESEGASPNHRTIPMQDKESDGSKLKDAIDRALVRFVTDRLTEEIRNDVLTAIKEAGYAVVPREPTREMLQAAAEVEDEAAIQNYGGRPDYESIWDAMITAGEE